MRSLKFLLISILLGGVTMVCANRVCSAPAGDGPSTFTLAHDASRGGGVYGPSIAIDPLFEYYRTHSLDEVARAIRREGFTAVQISQLTEVDAAEERRFADAFRRAGLATVLRLYPPTDFALYQNHPDWRQRMLGNEEGKNDWRGYLCPNRQEYVEAHCRRIEDHMRNGAYDGVQIAEIWFEQWGGPLDEKTGRPRANYACICDACVAEFRSISGVDPREMFLDPQGSRYFNKPENRALYKQWVDFRVDTIQAFGASLIAAVRRANPNAVINVTFLSDTTAGLGGSREFQANDIDRMVSEWKPDILTIQDAWQDWLRPELRPEFVAAYAKAYRKRILDANPSTFIMTHADLGSLAPSKRSRAWIRRFAQATVDYGLGAPSGYEWSVTTLAAELDAARTP